MLQVDFNNIIASRIGGQHGLNKAELARAIRRFSGVCQEVTSERQKGLLPFLDLAGQDTSSIEKLAQSRAKSFQDFVVLGIGGSALGAKALHNALHYPLYNLLPSSKRHNYPRLFILDNVDPEETRALFQLLNPRTTLFNIVTKSGETTETIASFMLAVKLLKKVLGKNYTKNIIVTTDRNKGFLRKLVIQEKLTSFEVPEGVGGRYSVLSPVGLIPAAFTGINIRRLLAGARQMDKLCSEVSPRKNPAYLTALVNFLMDTKKHKPMVIMMPYAAALKDLTDWFRQLWAESLGKRYNLAGKEVFTGPTPINALGVTDQHSQIQLYNEGPNNKLIIFMEVEKFRTEVKIPSLFKNEPSAGFLANHTFNELMRAEKRGTEFSLTKHQRPNYTIRLDTISEETIGGLLYFWELAAAYAGKLYRVNTFNQPGVEAGKKATFALMGKPGYQAMKPEIESLFRKKQRWIIP